MPYRHADAIRHDVLLSLRHAELVSTSVRGEWIVKARSEILK